MDSKIKISIIIPIYKVEPYIRKSLESVVNQTLKEIEIICVNDCSPDNSFGIVEEFANNDPRFVLIEQKTNQGQGVARNEGIKIAKGEYLMFLDPDDWLELNSCEILYKKAREHNANVIRGNYKEHYVDKGVVKAISYSEKIKQKYKTEIFNNTFFDIRDIPQFEFDFNDLSPCYQLYLTSFIKEQDIKFGPYNRAEDHIFSVDVKLATKIFYIEDCVYNYLIRKDSSRSYPVIYDEIVDAIAEIINNKYKDDIYAQKQLVIYTVKRYLFKFKKEYGIKVVIF